MTDELFSSFESAEEAAQLAKAIVATVREPLLVLDQKLRVVVASRSFISHFDFAESLSGSQNI